MKSMNKHIDFDSIGSQVKLTKEDKDLISAYFKSKKSTVSKLSKSTRTKKTKKVVV